MIILEASRLQNPALASIEALFALCIPHHERHRLIWLLFHCQINHVLDLLAELCTMEVPRLGQQALVAP